MNSPKEFSCNKNNYPLLDYQIYIILETTINFRLWFIIALGQENTCLEEIKRTTANVRTTTAWSKS